MNLRVWGENVVIKKCAVALEQRWLHTFLMKQKFVITHQYSFIGDHKEKKLHRSLIDQHLSTSCFYENIRRNNFLWMQDFDRRCVCNSAVQ
jgi:hypothetical protein